MNVEVCSLVQGKAYSKKTSVTSLSLDLFTHTYTHTSFQLCEKHKDGSLSCMLLNCHQFFTFWQSTHLYFSVKRGKLNPGPFKSKSDTFTAGLHLRLYMWAGHNQGAKMLPVLGKNKYLQILAFLADFKSPISSDYHSEVSWSCHHR